MRGKESTIIKYLIEHKNEELNINRISKALKMDYKNVHTIVKRLENASLVNIETFGQSCRVKLIPVMHPLVFEAEYLRRKDVLKNKDFAVMLSSFRKKIRSRLYIILLFGSYAKKTQRKASDIDLMFICPDGLEEPFEKDVTRVAGTMPLPLHPLVFSESQYIEMIGAKEPNVGQEAFRHNIILYGIEQFYGMI
ncbi:MAG: nucleotidyltransferase domain-containing protein [Nanoarchaeota archaeon]|nr:nucleotidyltransferase domain-containing protein [Nanoarchaeota archaeon]